MNSDTPPNALLDYSLRLLGHAHEVIDRHEELGMGAYSESVGPHLRHVIEHYEALLRAATDHVHSSFVDYDGRRRDQQLECDPHVAQLRLRGVQTALQNLRGNGLTGLAQTVAVRVLIGNVGNIELSVQSNIARELIFLASHTVHHFALLEALAKSHGASFGVNFGRAPATMANDRSAEKHS